MSLVEVRGYVDVEIQVADETPVVTRMKVLNSQETTILLGREFLRKFGSVTFDFDKGMISLGRSRIPIRATMMGGTPIFRAETAMREECCTC